MYLDEIEIGQEVTVETVGGTGATRQHFLDMGLIPGATIELVKFAPMGDPIEYKINGYELTLRKADAQKIAVSLNTNKEEETEKTVRKQTLHPYLGEAGIHHDKKTEKALQEDELLTFALVGNQNAGKTTLFNQLTGSNQHVGNFPGVTVDRKDGQIRHRANTVVTDLPGIYSMSPYSPEELVTRDFILQERPKGIINIVDATTIERGLYLTMQLLELDIPMVLALNMMDEVRNNGGYIDINALEEKLGIPVLSISAANNEGIEELIDHAIHVAKYQERPKVQDFCFEDEDGGAVHRCLHSIMYLIEDHAADSQLPLRFVASKCAEKDEPIIEMLQLDQNEKDTLEHIVSQMEKERKLDRAAAIADMRYDYIRYACKGNVIVPKQSKERERSMKIDKILTGKYTAIPFFLGIMAVIFYLTFFLVGPILQNGLASLIADITLKTSLLLSELEVSHVLHSLIIDGIFEGVGAVLSFLPVIILLFLFLSLLEDSGYMARIAFVMDKILRRIGLSGRSIVPLLMGFGCTVPAVMSTRTLPSERDRKMTILLTPFMSCPAKLPIYIFFAEAFFPERAGLTVICLYLLGIFTGILTAFLYKNTFFRSEAVPFVMELPNYRLPAFRNVMQLLWEKAKDFLQRAFTVIFVASIAVWFLQSFSIRLALTDDPEKSLLALLATFITPIFKPLGFGTWQIVVSLASGFIAKETVVSSLHVLLPGELLHTVLTPLSAVSLLIFCLLYTPCIAAVSAIKKELGSKGTAFVVLFQCLLAWICSFLFYTVASLF